MAFLVLPPFTVQDWNWGGSVGKLRIFASQAFFETTTGEYTAQGQPTNIQSACQVYDCTVTSRNFVIPEVTMPTTTDSTVPNALLTAVLYDHRDVARYTLLSNAFVDPEYFNTPEVSDVQVLSAGLPEVDGIYTLRGADGGYNYYTLTGQSSPTPPIILPEYSVYTDGNLWYISNSAGDPCYFGSTGTSPATDYPWNNTTWGVVAAPGVIPAPNVTEYVTEIDGTWEQLTLSNQGYGQVVPWSIPGPFWNVPQVKAYVNSVVGDGSSPVPYASISTAGKTKLDTAPASSTAPIAIGTNSAVITTINSSLTSLDTLKAPKASPAFTGGISVTGGITATTTIAATGNVTGANLSGTNTGNVTLAGENYLSLASQVITAGAVNLSGSNVTGTMAAARMPALTGDVTTSAGAVATTIANLAVTNAKVATGIDAVKIADGSVSNTEFQYLNGVSSAIQTQIDAKAGLVSPSFTTPSLGTVASGVLTACTVATPTAGDNDTSIASTAFVQGLGNGCLVYRATLTQTSTNAPVATVISNTLGGTVVWARTTIGVYTATLASVFSANKTQIFIGTGAGAVSFAVLKPVRTSSSVITLTTMNIDMSVDPATDATADGLLAETAITIIVGP